MSIVCSILRPTNPELFTTKVQYIRDNDVSDLDLVFAEEEYDSGGGAPVVSL